jgi:isocitrate dehydrogenase (NAD+)
LKTHNITLIPGDGIGPEITEATRRVLEATGVRFNWDVVNAGAGVQEEYGTPLPEHVLESIRRNKVAIKGPVTTPVGSGFRSVNVAMRKLLELYACVRPCKSYIGAPTIYRDIDIVVIRENTEGLYSGIEFEKNTTQAAQIIKLIEDTLGAKVRKDSGISIKNISEMASRRIVRFAFEYARADNKKKVTAVHKANIMKFSDGLFLEAARQEAGGYPDIEFEERIVDNMTMQLVKKPQQFDVIVTPNLYGDILSDLCAGLVGGLGLAPGANIGDDYALFEATHGSAPKYKGLNQRLEEAIAAVIAEGKNVTYDMKPEAERDRAVGTSQVADAVIEKLKG